MCEWENLSTKAMIGQAIAVICLWATIILLANTTNVSADVFKMDACSWGNITWNNTAMNFTIPIFNQTSNSTYNQTIFFQPNNITFNCNSSKQITTSTINLSTQPTAQVVTVFLWNNAIWFDNSTQYISNASWMREQFNAWSGTLNYNKTEIDSLSKGTQLNQTNYDSKITALTNRTAALEELTDGQFGTGWKTIIVITLLLSLGCLIALAMLIMQGSNS